MRKVKRIAGESNAGKIRRCTPQLPEVTRDVASIIGSDHPGLERGVVVGWASAAISALIGFAVIPIQLRLLGAEAFGLIGFCVTLQSILLVLDLGVTATINREVARCASSEDRMRVAGLLGAMDWIFWLLALACAGAIALLAPFIGKNWLNAQSLPLPVVVQAIAIAGILIAVRWPITLYQSALLGQRQAVLNSLVTMASAIASAAAGVAVLLFVAADVRWFIASQALVGAAQLFVLRRAVGRIVLDSVGWQVDFGQIRRIWRFSVLTGLVTVVGVCFMQMDKVILSKLLGLRDLGYYSLAAVVASVIYALTMPVFNVVYPRFSALIAAGQFNELERLYRSVTHLMAALLGPVGIVIALFSHDLLALWTGNDQLAAEVAPLVSWLVLGSTLHGIMFIPFALTLARGAAGLALKINLALLASVGPLIVAGAVLWNAEGAAAAWLLLHLAYISAGSIATHRILMPSLRFRWLLLDVAAPLAWAAAAGLVGAWAVSQVQAGLVMRVVLAGAVFVACLLITFGSSPVLRLWASQRQARA